MKYFVLFLVFLSFSIEGVFADPIPGSYEEYTENVTDFCSMKGDNAPKNKSELWGDWASGSLLSIDKIDYPSISDSNPNLKYDQVLVRIGSDTWRLRTIGLLTNGPSYLEKASYVYKEVMGATYSCAVINAKIRIVDNMLKVQSTQSELKKSLTSQLERMRKSVGKKGCRLVDDTTELSIKKTLLDNATYQYCNYRTYLYYLDMASKNSMNEYFKIPANEVKKEQNLVSSTDMWALLIENNQQKIQNEATHARETFSLASIAFTEFDRTYASHVILQFILQDYIKLRASLRSLLSPIGQVIYKASNAQSPK